MGLSKMGYVVPRHCPRYIGQMWEHRVQLSEFLTKLWDISQFVFIPRTLESLTQFTDSSRLDRTVKVSEVLKSFGQTFEAEAVTL
jgi:hypothetical protein